MADRFDATFAGVSSPSNGWRSGSSSARAASGHIILPPHWQAAAIRATRAPARPVRRRPLPPGREPEGPDTVGPEAAARAVRVGRAGQAAPGPATEAGMATAL